MSAWFTDLAQFHFLRPWWLLALVPAIWLGYKLWHSGRKSGEWREYVAPHLLRYLLEGEDRGSSRLWVWALLAAWALAILALAGPAWQKLPQPVQKGGAPLVILWDLSPSMWAQDVEPSRLVRSRLKIIDLLRQREEGLTGLVAYAAEAHVVTPLTDDVRTIINLLPALKPGMMPRAGSNPEMAVRMGQQLLANAGVSQGNLLLVTDEVVPGAFDRLQNLLEDSDHQLTIWGVGTSAGAPIPLPGGDFARDYSGNTVVAKLNEGALQEFASDTGAYYVPMLPSEQDVETLQRLFQNQEADLRQSSRMFDNWYEHGPWLLLLILPFVAFAFRRGWLLSVPLVLLPLSAPQPAQAMTWEDLWQTENQQAQEALQRGDAERAAELFERPNWRGTALYRAQDYQAALEAFRQGKETADNLYNRGNALMQLQEYKAALEAYEQALAKDPTMADARANKELAEKLLRQQQQQKDQQGQEGQEQQDQKGDSGQPQSQPGQNQGQNDQAGQQRQKGRQQGQPAQSDQAGQDGAGEATDDPTNNNPGEPRPAQERARDGEEPDNRRQDGRNQAQDPQESEAGQRSPAPAGRGASDAGDESATTATRGMSETEREQQQALEQWLRKLPDDPSALLRNKFLHEYRERRLENAWREPPNNADERW